jgi:hypothetical protein
MKCPPKIEPLEFLVYVNNDEIIFTTVIGQTSVNKNSTVNYLIHSWCRHGVSLLSEC